MTTPTRNISRAAWKAAEQQMKKAGWTEILSACSSAGDSIDEFGTLYIREGQEFWLNYRTIGSLPA
jgi:mannose-6-phosphate isomerase class I